MPVEFENLSCSMRGWRKCGTTFLMVAAVAIAATSFGMMGKAHAQNSGPWVGLTDEPPMLNATGTLQDSSTIVVRAIIDGHEKVLKGDNALVFLSSRNYIDYDGRRWRTTDKYKAWNERRVNAGYCACEDWNHDGLFGVVRNGKLIQPNYGPYIQCMIYAGTLKACK